MNKLKIWELVTKQLIGLPHPYVDPISSTASKQGPGTVLLILLFLDYQSVWFRVLSVGTSRENRPY